MGINSASVEKYSGCIQVCPSSGAFIARKSVEYRKSIFILQSLPNGHLYLAQHDRVIPFLGVF